jgi:hypothetical protein
MRWHGMAASQHGGSLQLALSQLLAAANQLS